MAQALKENSALESSENHDPDTFTGSAADAVYGRDKNDGPLQEFFETRDALLKEHDVPTDIIHKAYVTLSHLLLDDGMTVVDMGSNGGEMSYAMAVLNPKVKFIGIEKDKRKVIKASEKFKAHNLEFIPADILNGPLEPESADVIINSNFLHSVYSSSSYNDQIVGDILETQFRILKTGGFMFIRDYSRPMPGEYVLVEMPDIPSSGHDIKSLSEPDLLVWYSEHARPKEDPVCSGFFLEELPPRLPQTRLFRMPAKWAYEFIMRKDNRDEWDRALPVEYTFFTPREFRKELSALGARVHYSAPQWDEDHIKKNFEGKFRLFSDDGKSMGFPPTGYVVVAQKIAERKSINIEERRPSSKPASHLQISAVRDEKTGNIRDLVSRNMDVSEILPYRVNAEGRLKVYLHDGLGRGIANAVPRRSYNIDGRRWSGHMIEAIAVDSEATIGKEFDHGNSIRFARDYLGMQPEADQLLKQGPDYYPAPDFIDERVHTYYINVKKANDSIRPRKTLGDLGQFQAKGEIREFDAQQVLNAIHMGLIPNSRLELQILSLFEHEKVQAENWAFRRAMVQATEAVSRMDIKDLLRQLSESDERFKNIKGTAGDLRAVHSIFVEEGQSRGAVTGLSAEDMEFVITEEDTINTAVVMPLVRSVKGEIHAGFLVDHLPIPQRHEGNSKIVNVPAFRLPDNIKSMEQMKKFIADRFGVLPDMVIKMGESYFSHLGMTPQRIHPFGVAAPPDWTKASGACALPLWELAVHDWMLKKNQHFMTLVTRSWKTTVQDHIKADFKAKVREIMDEEFAMERPDWGIPLEYRDSPTVIADLESQMADLEHANQLNIERTREAAPNVRSGFGSKSTEMPTQSKSEPPPVETQTVSEPVKADAPAETPLNESSEVEQDIQTSDSDTSDDAANNDKPKPQPEKW